MMAVKEAVVVVSSILLEMLFVENERVRAHTYNGEEEKLSVVV